MYLNTVVLQQYCSNTAQLLELLCSNIVAICIAAVLLQPAPRNALQQYCRNTFWQYCRKSNLHTKNDITAILLQHIARMLLQYCGNIAGRCCQKVNILVRAAMLNTHSNAHIRKYDFLFNNSYSSCDSRIIKSFLLLLF